MTGLQIQGAAPFVTQAYANDSFFRPKNSPQELHSLMASLSLNGLAAGLNVNFEKSKLLLLKDCDWHAVLWPGQIVHSEEIIRHLGYPIG